MWLSLSLGAGESDRKLPFLKTLCEGGEVFARGNHHVFSPCLAIRVASDQCEMNFLLTRYPTKQGVQGSVAKKASKCQPPHTSSRGKRLSAPENSTFFGYEDSLSRNNNRSNNFAVDIDPGRQEGIRRASEDRQRDIRSPISLDGFYMVCKITAPHHSSAITEKNNACLTSVLDGSDARRHKGCIANPKIIADL